MWLVFDVGQKMKRFAAVLIFSIVGCSKPEHVSVAPEPAVRTAEGRPQYAIDGMPARFAVLVYEQLSGKKVAMTAEVEASQIPVFASYGGDDREEALDRLRRALLASASIEFIAQKDGSLVARIVTKKKNA